MRADVRVVVAARVGVGDAARGRRRAARERRRARRVAQPRHGGHAPHEVPLDAGEAAEGPPRARRDGPPLGQADGVAPQAAHVPRAVELVVVLGKREEERRLRHARAEQRALAVHEVDDQALDALREALRPPGPALEEHDAPIKNARRVARRLARHGLAAVPGARAAADAPRRRRAVRLREGKINILAQHLRAVLDGRRRLAPQIHARELVDVAPHDDVRVQVQDARRVGQDVRQVERREVEGRQQLLALHARRVAEHLQRAHGRPELELVVQAAADAHAEVERRPLAS